MIFEWYLKTRKLPELLYYLDDGPLLGCLQIGKRGLNGVRRAHDIHLLRAPHLFEE